MLDSNSQAPVQQTRSLDSLKLSYTDTLFYRFSSRLFYVSIDTESTRQNQLGAPEDVSYPLFVASSYVAVNSWKIFFPTPDYLAIIR